MLRVKKRQMQRFGLGLALSFMPLLAMGKIRVVVVSPFKLDETSPKRAELTTNNISVNAAKVNKYLFNRYAKIYTPNIIPADGPGVDAALEKLKSDANMQAALLGMGSRLLFSDTNIVGRELSVERDLATANQLVVRQVLNPASKRVWNFEVVDVEWDLKLFGIFPKPIPGKPKPGDELRDEEGVYTADWIRAQIDSFETQGGSADKKGLMRKGSPESVLLDKISKAISDDEQRNEGRQIKTIVDWNIALYERDIYHTLYENCDSSCKNDKELIRRLAKKYFAVSQTILENVATLHQDAMFVVSAQKGLQKGHDISRTDFEPKDTWFSEFNQQTAKSRSNVILVQELQFITRGSEDRTETLAKLQLSGHYSDKFVDVAAPNVFKLTLAQAQWELLHQGVAKSVVAARLAQILEKNITANAEKLRALFLNECKVYPAYRERIREGRVFLPDFDTAPESSRKVDRFAPRVADEVRDAATLAAKGKP